MKKLLAVLVLSTFGLGAYTAVAHPNMLQDTTKKHKMKRDTMRRDTSKKPPKK